MRKSKGKNQRKKSIHIRLDDGVFDELHDLKKLGGFKSWEVLVLFLINEKKGFKKVYVDEEGHAEKVLRHINRFANNLNQLARIANACGKIDDIELNKMRKFFNEAIKARNYFNKKVRPFSTIVIP